MRLEQALYNRLSTYAPLAALVGDRINPVRLSQGTAYPAVSYFRVSRPTRRTFGGNAAIASPRFQFDCWAKRYTDAKAVADQLIAALNNFSGTLGGAGGVEVKDIELMNEADDDFMDTADLYHTIVEFTIWHT